MQVNVVKGSERSGWGLVDLGDVMQVDEWFADFDHDYLSVRRDARRMNPRSKRCGASISAWALRLVHPPNTHLAPLHLHLGRDDQLGRSRQPLIRLGDLGLARRDLRDEETLVPRCPHVSAIDL